MVYPLLAPLLSKMGSIPANGLRCVATLALISSATVELPFSIQETRIDHAQPVLAPLHRRGCDHDLADALQAAFEQAQTNRLADRLAVGRGGDVTAPVAADRVVCKKQDGAVGWHGAVFSRP